MPTRGETPGPIFIVGMNGSGTTMLLDHLANHSALYGHRQETRLLPPLLRRRHALRDLTVDADYRRLWDRVRTDFGFASVNKGQPLPLPADWRDAPRNLGRVFDRLMLDLAAREGKGRWCEKTPGHVLHLEALAELFPGAQFLHLIRDGRACARSMHRRWGFNPLNTVWRWRIAVGAGRRAARQLGSARYMEVLYEDLTAQPQAWLEKICAFAQLPFEPALLETARHRPRFTGSEHKQIAVNPLSLTTYFSERHLVRMEEIAGDALREVGYPLLFGPPLRLPTRAERVAWRIGDGAAFLRNLLRRQLGERPSSWPLAARRVASAARHRLLERL